MARARSARRGGSARAARAIAGTSRGRRPLSRSTFRQRFVAMRYSQARTEARPRSARARARRPAASPGRDPRRPEPSRGSGSSAAGARPVGVGELAERVLVSGAGAGERCSVTSRILACTRTSANDTIASGTDRPFRSVSAVSDPVTPTEEELAMNMPPIVSPQEWQAAREELLVKEKELTRARDALAAKRRRMPRMAVEKEYRFEGPDGPASLLDLFEGRRQLIVYRFFYEPGVAGWPESGCLGCSMVADQVAHPAHLNARDTTLAFVSRAPQADIERWKARMGWEHHPVVHADRRLRRRLRRRRVARHQRLLPRRRGPDLPHLLRQRPRRRGDGQHLELPRHHRARAPGGVGGLAGGLPADPALRVVEAPRRVRRATDRRGALQEQVSARAAWRRAARARDLLTWEACRWRSSCRRSPARAPACWWRAPG